jgi:hypothetical protein
MQREILGNVMKLGFPMNSVVHLQQQNRFKQNFPEIEIGYTKMTSKHPALQIHHSFALKQSK